MVPIFAYPLCFMMKVVDPAYINSHNALQEAITFSAELADYATMLRALCGTTVHHAQHNEMNLNPSTPNNL
jgi:hypothetical protein